MKKIATLLILIVFVSSLLCSCNLFKKEKYDEPLRIGYMAGPTGMGMAKLVADNGGLDNGNEKYVFTKYADTNTAKADLAAGKIDIICLPTNEAAAYYNKVDNKSKVLAINCLNSLFLLTKSGSEVNSLSELEGKTIYTCKNGTPRLVIEHILESTGLNVDVSYTFDNKDIVTPADLSALVVAGKLPNAVLPEPLVTSSLLSIAKNGNKDISYSVSLNLSTEWDKISDTPVAMGCIIARGNILENAENRVKEFLAEYKASVEYIGNPANIDSAANYVVETGVMGALPAAKKALTNLGSAISYIDGGDMKNTLINFYNAIGIELPNDGFYY